ncbi:MAG: PD-(D/E)XK nuclease family protein, partial [Planctomycetota bacterium]|nr:PD-(D/E)XK nuclease family protein [Planctomycetota bacterium]
GREALIRRIAQLHADACEAMVDFSSIMEMVPEGVAGGEERRRWEVLLCWQKARTKKLEELGLQCPYAQRVHSLSRGEIATGLYTRLVLVDGEPTPVRIALLERLDSLGLTIERVVPSGELPEAVDPIRGPAPEVWAAPPFGLPDSNIHVADGSQDVGSLVAGIIKQSGIEKTSDVTLVCPDSSLEASVQSILPEFGVPARVANAGVLLDSALGQLLHATLAILGGGWSEVEDALRIPGFASAVDVDERVLEEVDRSRRLCVGVSLEDEKMGGREDTPRSVTALRVRIEQMLQPLRCSLGFEAADAVVDLVRKFLDQGLPERVRGENKEVATSIQRFVEEFRSAPKVLVQEVEANTLIRMVLRSFSSDTLAPDPEDTAVEIVGWMESAFDPAALRIVVGMNETMVPQMPAPEPLLPDSLRDHCGLSCQKTRTARDTWLMWLLESSRSSDAQVDYVVARESCQGDRLLPSRLLLPDLPETVERLPRLLCDRLDQSIRVSTEMVQHNDSKQDVNFPLVPSVLPKVERMSVTEFRLWLDSPLRFVLKKLSLGRTFAPWRPELDAIGFGNMIHGTLERWGREEIANGPTKDVSRIYAAMKSHLLAYANDMFGKKRPPALQLQIEIAESRLKAFSEHQQKLALEGWHIEHVELHFTDQKVDEPNLPEPITPLIRAVAPEIVVTGKIDRVDRHIEGRRRAFDYKTGNDGSVTAESAHRKVHKDDDIQWLDLQLPLYRQRLLEDGTGEVEVGYILLPQHMKKTRVDLLSWGPEDFKSANACADEILIRVQALEANPLSEVELEEMGAFDRDRFGVLWGEGIRTVDAEEEESE